MTIWGRAKEFDGTHIISGAGERRRQARNLTAYWVVAALTLCVDLLTKWAITTSLQLGQSLPLIEPFLRLTYVRNTGAAFSLLANLNSPWRSVFLIVVPALAFVFLAVLAHREKHRGLTLMLPLGLVSGGAIGNLLDRLATGTVVDFIDMGLGSLRWPVYNAADSAVVIGVCWLMFLTLRESPRRSERRK